MPMAARVPGARVRSLRLHRDDACARAGTGGTAGWIIHVELGVAVAGGPRSAGFGDRMGPDSPEDSDAWPIPTRN